MPGTFLLPAGTVNFSTVLVIPPLCTIQGRGIGASTLLLAPKTVLSPAAIINGRESEIGNGTLDTDITMQDLTLDLNTSNQAAPSYGVWMNNIAYSNFTRFEVDGGMVHFGIGGVDATSASYTHDLTFVDPYFHNAGMRFGDDEDTLQFTAQNVVLRGGTLGPSTDTGAGLLAFGTSNLVFYNVTFVDNAQACGVAGGPTPGNIPSTASKSQFGNNNVMISGGSMTCSGTSAFAISDGLGDNWTIKNTRIMLTPITTGTSSASALSFDGGSNIAVSGVVVNGAKVAGVAILSLGSETVDNVCVSGGLISDTNGPGIILQVAYGSANMSNISVSDVTIQNPGAGTLTTAEPGIYVSQDSTGVQNSWSISNNTISDDQATHTMNYGVQYGGNPVVSVEGNTITGYTIGEFSSIALAPPPGQTPFLGRGCRPSR
jgi:hypothetical protein